MAGLKNVVLVHGGFVDGAGWGGVYKILRNGGKTKFRSSFAADMDLETAAFAQRAMAKRANSTIAEVKGSHAIYVSQPGAVAGLIEQAAKSVNAAGA